MSEAKFWQGRAKQWRDEAATARDPVARETLLMLATEAEMIAADVDPSTGQGEHDAKQPG